MRQSTQIGTGTFCASATLSLSAKDGDRLDEEKARLDNVDKAEKGETNAAAPAAAAAPEKTPEKKAETVKGGNLVDKISH